MELETPLELLEPLTFILSRLVKQLCCRLLARSLATNEVKLTLELEALSPVISSDTRLSSPGIGDPFIVPPWQGEGVKKSDMMALRCSPLTPGP